MLDSPHELFCDVMEMTFKMTFVVDFTSLCNFFARSLRTFLWKILEKKLTRTKFIAIDKSFEKFVNYFVVLLVIGDNFQKEISRY